MSLTTSHGPVMPAPPGAGPAPGALDNERGLSRAMCGTAPVIERRAGLAPAFPRGKRGVFPWTTNAAPADRSYGDQLKIHYSRWKVGKEAAPDAAGAANPVPNPEGPCENALAARARRRLR